MTRCEDCGDRTLRCGCPSVRAERQELARDEYEGGDE